MKWFTVETKIFSIADSVCINHLIKQVAITFATQDDTPEVFFNKTLDQITRGLGLEWMSQSRNANKLAACHQRVSVLVGICGK